MLRRNGKGCKAVQSEEEEIPLHSISANGITTSLRTGWDSNPRYAMNVHTLSRLESIGRDSDKMSSFHYDGPRNVLCTPAQCPVMSASNRHLNRHLQLRRIV